MSKAKTKIVNIKIPLRWHNILKARTGTMAEHVRYALKNTYPALKKDATNER